MGVYDAGTLWEQKQEGLYNTGKKCMCLLKGGGIIVYNVKGMGYNILLQPFLNVGVDKQKRAGK